MYRLICDRSVDELGEIAGIEPDETVGANCAEEARSRRYLTELDEPCGVGSANALWESAPSGHSSIVEKHYLLIGKYSLRNNLSANTALVYEAYFCQSSFLTASAKSHTDFIATAIGFDIPVYSTAAITA